MIRIVSIVFSGLLQRPATPIAWGVSLYGDSTLLSHPVACGCSLSPQTAGPACPTRPSHSCRELERAPPAAWLLFVLTASRTFLRILLLMSGAVPLGIVCDSGACSVCSSLALIHDAQGERYACKDKTHKRTAAADWVHPHARDHAKEYKFRKSARPEAPPPPRRRLE